MLLEHYIMTQGLRLWGIPCTLVEVPTFSRNSLPSSSGGEVGGNGCWRLCTNLHSNLKHVLSIDLEWCNSGQCETMFGRPALGTMQFINLSHTSS